MRFIVIVGVLSCMSGHAFAEAAGDAAADGDAKSGSVATGLSLGVTAAGIGIMFASTQVAVRDGNETNQDLVALAGAAVVMVGPSAGHIYAGETEHAVIASLVRGGGMAMLVGAAISKHCILGPSWCQEDSRDQLLDAVGVVGGVAFLGATIYDLYDAHRAVDREAGHGLVVTPSVMPARGGPAPAIVVGGVF